LGLINPKMGMLTVTTQQRKHALNTHYLQAVVGVKSYNSFNGYTYVELLTRVD
jgi:hypothetical protein